MTDEMLPNAVTLPELTNYGTDRIYAHNCDEAQQKWLIDHLGMIVQLNLPGGMRIAAVVRRVKGDQAILERR